MLLSFGKALATGLAQAMEMDKRVFAYGEGINDPGGYFGSTVGIMERFSESRCFDVPNSEESLVGLGIGASLLGYRPVFVTLRPEFLMLAMNQIVNHAAKWSAMCGYQCSVSLTIRTIIGKNWGQAAQHSGAYHSLFANIPGLQVVLPSSVRDAPGLLLSAIFSDSPTIFIEAKPLYDLEGEVDLPIKPLPLGRANIVREGSDITFIAISYMVDFAKEVALKISDRGVEATVIDLRTVSPLDESTILKSVHETKRVAVFDIGWPRFGLASEIARVVCADSHCNLLAPLERIARRDEHTPASCFLESQHYAVVDEVVQNVLQIL